MRGKTGFLVPLLGLVLAACTSAAPADRSGPASVPREVLSIRTPSGPATIEVPAGSVLFERDGALASPDGTRLYAASVFGGRTVVETNDAVSGELIARAPVAGEHELVAVSGSGRAAALTDPLPRGWDPAVPVPRAWTSIVVADPTGGTEPRAYRLRGNFEPEAFSVADDRLFLIQFLPAQAPEVYRVTVLDLRHGDVYPVFGPYKGPAERMPGTRLEQILSPDGARLYTLYSSSRPGFAPHDAPVPANADVSFVHVLDLREGWAHCVALPRQLWDRPAAEQTMAVSPDGSTLFVADAARGVVAAMNTDTLETRYETEIAFGVVGDGDATAQVSADGATLFVAGGGGASTLFALDTTSLQISDRWAFEGPVSGLGLSMDGERLYVATPDRVDVLDPLTGETLAGVPFANPSPILHLEPIAG